MTPITKVTILSTVGGVCILLGAIFLGVFPVIFDSILNDMLVLREGSASLEAFITPPVPIYMQVWLFNVTNPEAIKHRGEIPKLQQVGPYTYEEQRLKYDLIWNETSGTVSYLQNKTYYFRPDLSYGHLESDPITTLNAIMLTAAKFLNDVTLARLFIWPEIERTMDIFETRTAGELVYKGYDLPTDFNFDFSSLGLNFTSGLSGDLYEILDNLGLDPPAELQENKFGFFYGRNNTNDKRYEVKTGAHGMDTYQEIVAWDDENKLEFWSSKYCNMINGTDGSQYPPKITKSKVIMIYTSELCRSLYLLYEKEVEVEGVRAYRFVPPRSMLEDPMINHDNLCYCYPDEDHCLGAGMLSMEPCTMGAPIIMSTPHFYQGDDDERDKLIGLHPSKAEHETILDVEPTSGVTMRAAKKIQINLQLRPYGKLPSFKNVPEVVFPVLWINESAVIDPVSAAAFSKGVVLPFTIVDAICGVLIVIGVGFLIGGIVIFRKYKNSHQKV
ncbi:lysosome membrane protein 2-like [Oratosquilla oratoria]|uniref:lysosome membrane protein 2-like n=1 Tax=Oratosquilla oratoria TaxID=337810 RepID=UPI003F75E94F